MCRMELVVLLTGLVLALGVVEGVPLGHCELLLVETFVRLRSRQALGQKSTGQSSDLVMLSVAAGTILFKMRLVHRPDSEN